MAAVPQKTLNWLWDVLRREYHDPQRTYSDLAQTLSSFPGFSPRTDVYTYENGVPALLVHLVGVVPVSFRGATYRFPVALWIPHAYPSEAPVVYVTPTDDMLVRPGQHVGGDGRVYHHYLAHWREARDRSNVVEFLSMLSQIFAKEPPVISKQQLEAHRQPPPPPHHHQPTPPPRPPLPGEAPRQHSLSQTRLQHAPPPPPPKQPTDQDGRRPSPSQSRPGRYDAPLPLPGQVQRPPRPPSINQQAPQGNGNVTQPPRQPQYLPPRGSSLRDGQPPQQWSGQAGHLPSQAYPTQPPQQIHPYQQKPPNQPHPPLHAPGQPHPHHAHHLQHHQPPPQALQYYPPQQALPRQQPPTSKAPDQDLLSSPFDISLPVSRTPPPAPPIPRNPEKDALLAHLSSVLTSTLHSSVQQSNTAIGPLQSQNAALQNTLATLNNEIHQLKHLQEGLNGNISLLRSSLTSADTSIANAKHRAHAGDVPKVDEMLIAPHVASRQLYDVVTEERGIDAAIFALQEAFVRGRVSSEVWGRRTRELAREGFKKRYLGRRIGGGMGLEM